MLFLGFVVDVEDVWWVEMLNIEIEDFFGVMNVFVGSCDVCDDFVLLYWFVVVVFEDDEDDIDEVQWVVWVVFQWWKSFFLEQILLLWMIRLFVMQYSVMLIFFSGILKCWWQVSWQSVSCSICFLCFCGVCGV